MSLLKELRNGKSIRFHKYSAATGLGEAFF